MDTYSINQAESTEKKHTQHFGAHSGFRLGLSDYNDGESSPDSQGVDVFDGSVALGNNNEADDESDHGKYHSGL